jgi:hypothetical protein
MGCRVSSRGGRSGEGIHGEGVDARNVSDGDALWQGHEDVAPSLGQMTTPSAEVPAPAARPGSRRSYIISVVEYYYNTLLCLLLLLLLLYYYYYDYDY